MLLSMFWERDLRAGRIGLSRARGFSRAAATGKTLSIQGVGQGPSAEKIRCISKQRWTLRPVRGRGNS